nr:RNA-directed DNA polymerase, eukaryota [Tanacetum cinerariifolium]
MVVVYAPQELRDKCILWDYLEHVINQWVGEVVIMSDFNEVRFKSERFGLGFNVQGANVFNTFIANAGLEELDADIDKEIGSDDIVNKGLEVLNSIQHPDKIKAMDVAQKVKIKWVIRGDENTRFDKPTDNRVHIDMNFPKSITIDQQMDLECAVSKEELKRAVWECCTDKYPGPDGFSFGFYRQFWSSIENDVFAAVSHFFTFGDIPNGCNSCFIALIPKVPDANLVKDFRPISLIGSLRINMCKSKIIGVNVGDEKIKFAASKLGCLILNTSFSYLGTKVGGNMSRVQAWTEVVDKRFYSQKESLWARVIKAIYGDNGQVGKVSKAGSRSFLKYSFPRVYALETGKEVTVNSKMSDTRWVWSLEGSGVFSVASIRKIIDDNRLLIVDTRTLWIKDVPIKVNVLAWKIKIEALPTRDIVNEVQSAFITERQILDGSFILNEVIQWCKLKKKQSLIFKVDFEKAYDSVRWDFLDDVLKKFGFGNKLCAWIQSCLRSSRGSIIINGSPTEEFQFFKGIKQGDPLSPFLFILIMKSLHLSFQRVADVGMFKGINLSPLMNLSHMFYTDDAVFVGQWCDGNINTLVHVLECFFQSLGLRINMCKSKIMGVNVGDEKVKFAASKLGCLILNTTFSYLGTKVGGNMSRVQAWTEVVDKAGTVSVGPWGSKDGERWNFLLKGCKLTHITVVAKDCVYSIQFTYIVDKKSVKSKKYGGPAPQDATPHTIYIPDRKMLTGISGTVGPYPPQSDNMVVTSLCFEVDTNNNGPYGTPSETPFSVLLTSGAFSGFFGYCGAYLESLGVIISPYDGHVVEFGPWGGKDGERWNFLLNGCNLTKITVVSSKDCVYSIQFTYIVNHNPVSSPIYGGPGPADATTDTIVIPYDEKLTGISGTVGPYPPQSDNMVVTSLCFEVNTNNYGQFGTESGTPFSLPVESGDFSGFFGRKPILKSIGCLYNLLLLKVVNCVVKGYPYGHKEDFLLSLVECQSDNAYFISCSIATSKEDEVELPDDETSRYMSSTGGGGFCEDDLDFYNGYEAQLHFSLISYILMYFSSDGRSTLIRVDILVFRWVGRKHACVDVTGVSPLAGLSSRGFTVGQTALCKVTKHEKACIENQHVFILFAFDTFDFLAPEAVELLSRVQRVIHNNVITPKSTGVIFKRIGFAIKKGLAAQIVVRLPFTTV